MRGINNSWTCRHFSFRSCYRQLQRWAPNGSHFRDGEMVPEGSRRPGGTPTRPMSKNGNERLNVSGPRDTPPGQRRHFKTSSETEAPLVLPAHKSSAEKRSTFSDTLPAVPDVAGDAAAAEAGGEVPAFGVHRALVSAAGARRAGIRVVAENCSEKTHSARVSAPLRSAPGAGTPLPSPAGMNSRLCCGSETGSRPAALLKPQSQTGLKCGGGGTGLHYTNHQGKWG